MSNPSGQQKVILLIILFVIGGFLWVMRTIVEFFFLFFSLFTVLPFVWLLGHHTYDIYLTPSTLLSALAYTSSHSSTLRLFNKLYLNRNSEKPSHFTFSIHGNSPLARNFWNRVINFHSKVSLCRIITYDCSSTTQSLYTLSWEVFQCTKASWDYPWNVIRVNVCCHTTSWVYCVTDEFIILLHDERYWHEWMWAMLLFTNLK